MSTVVIDGQRRRVYSAEDLPLSIGGIACHVTVPGFRSEEPVAYLGRDCDDFFIQPANAPPRTPTITCNGVPLSTSRWIAGGDELAVGTARLRCFHEGDVLRIRVDDAEQRPAVAARPERSTRPPSPDSVISPAEFTPRWQSPPRRTPFTIRTRAVMLSAMLVVLVIGAWYVLTAQAVRVETTPAAEHLAIEGAALTPKIGGRYLLRPGIYVVTADLDGYMDLEAPLEVGPDTPATVSYSMEPLGAAISVRSKPVNGAEVVIDHAAVGTTPLDGVQLTAGDHTIEVHAPLHLPFSASLHIEPGDPPISIEAELKPNWAAVTVASSPSGATVLLDREVIGTTPLNAEVEAGDRLIEIRKSGHKPTGRRVQVAAGVPVDLGVVRLEPEDGRLAVVSQPGGATVAVDAEYRGTTPLELAVVPGASHEVRLSLAGHSTFTTDIVVGSGMRSEVRATLERLTGEVVFTSQPPGAQLLIDGQARGNTDQTLELEARPHEIEIRRDGYIPFRTTLTPEPGLTQAVRAALKQEGPAGLLQSISNPQGAELVLVGPGRFTMGASRREPGRRANEVLREVEITRPFYLAVNETSNREYREFNSQHLSGGYGGRNLEIDHHPVVNVTWENAARYCNWLSEKAGLPPVYVERNGSLVARSPMPHGYRLPTEAEWAWAARFPNATTAQKYAWGDSLPVPLEGGNYGDQSGKAVLGAALPDYQDGHPATAPVGSFRANALGLYNLGGNVAEWVQDIYAFTPTAPGIVEQDPTGPKTGPHHVIRGASWMDTSVTELRLTFRDYGDGARPDVGFRIARSAQ